MHADVVYVEEAFRAGAAGYLLKRSAAAELSLAINTVLDGGTYITPLIDWKPTTKLASFEPGSLSKLTPRQREVLQLVAKGCANKEIAVLLGISEKTVDYHKASIKSGAESKLHRGIDSVRYQAPNNRHLMDVGPYP